MKIELELDAEEWDVLCIAVEEWADLVASMAGEDGEPEWGEEQPMYRVEQKINEIAKTIKEVGDHGIMDHIVKRNPIQAD